MPSVQALIGLIGVTQEETHGDRRTVGCADPPRVRARAAGEPPRVAYLPCNPIR